MSSIAALRRALVGSALLLSAPAFTAAPALAASGTTEIYLANVRINVDVLVASSKMAASKARDDALRRAAADEVRHQGGVLVAFDRWRARQDGTAATEIAALPLQTGRSVAIDAPIDADTFAPPPGSGVLMTGASATLDRLASLDGAAFDASFEATQRDTLKRLEGLYDTYAQTGDNAALREMAKTELAEVRAEIAALDKS